MLRSIITKSAALGLGIALIALLELIVRTARIADEYQRETHILSEILEWDSILFWRLIPNLVVDYRGAKIRTGPAGWRGIDQLENNRGFLVLCVGDSVTFGWDVEEQDTYPKLLQKYLKQSNRRDRAIVVNAGVPGYSSWQCLQYYERKLRFLHPDLLILSCGINDRFTGQWTDQERALSESKPINRLITGINNLHLTMYLKGRFGKLESPKPIGLVDDGTGSVLRVPVSDYRENLIRFIETTRTDGVRLMFLNQKITHEPKGFNEHHQVMSDLADQYEIELVDVVSIFDALVYPETPANGAQQPKELMEASDVHDTETPAADAEIDSTEPQNEEETDQTTAETKTKPRWGRTLMSVTKNPRFVDYFLDNYHPNQVGYDIIAQEVSRKILQERKTRVSK